MGADEGNTHIMTRSEKMKADVVALLKARNPLIWIVTRELTRCEASIIDACQAAKYRPRFWDGALGLTSADGKIADGDLKDPTQVLIRLRALAEQEVWVLRDFHKWFADPYVLEHTRANVKALKASPPGQCRSMIIVSPASEVPPELAGDAIVLDWPMPDREEIAALLDVYVKQYGDGIAPNGTREKAIDAALGLTAVEADSCYARSMVTAKRIDPAIVAGEKKRVIARERVLTWYDPDPRGLDAIGGLDELKERLLRLKLAFGQDARAFGLPAPKGIFLAGVPGCGKSLTAKAVPAAFGMPLLRLDMGALRGKFVGESEANIRKALGVAEAIAPCVLWIDEIEKALAGSTGSQGDGGVAADALGAVLTWMQEKTAPVFVVATANDVTGLPPELMRKGRFDDLFFVDLPTQTEREGILRATLDEYAKRATNWAASGDGTPIDVPAVARQCEAFAGVEVAELVPTGLFEAFADGKRQLTTADLLNAAASVVPLSKTMPEKIKALREWSKRARPASKREEAQTSNVRALDIEN